MESLSYLGLLALFFVPTLTYVFVSRRKKILKLLPLIIGLTVVALIWFFISIPLGAYWGAWGYDPQKNLGYHIGADYVETLVWTICGTIVAGIVIGRVAEREEKKQKIWPFG